MTSNTTTPVEREHDAFLRWQKVRIDHFGYVVNIILTLTAATLGFAVNLVVGKNAPPPHLCQCTFYTSIISLLLAIALGLSVNLSRLYDFRNSARAARARELHERDLAGETLTAISCRKASQRDAFSSRADFYGKCTWFLIWAQMITFMIGTTFLAYTVLLVYPLQ